MGEWGPKLENPGKWKGLYIWQNVDGEWSVGEDGSALCMCGFTQLGLEGAQRIVAALGGDRSRIYAPCGCRLTEAGKKGARCLECDVETLEASR